MSGAGKSTVSRVYAERGFTVVDCDLCAREVVKPGCPALQELHDRFSRDVILPDGNLDRRAVSGLIFHDPGKKVLFNKIIYPYITYNITEKIKRGGELILLDAPTLFESRLDFICGSIVSVVADTDVCAARITARDNIPEELARSRLRSQHGAEFYRTRSEFCLENNGTEAELFAAAARTAERLKGNS